MMKLWNLLTATLVSLSIASCTQPLVSQTPSEVADYNESIVLNEFEKDLEELRQAFKIPGMSAAIIRDQELVWS